MSAAEGTAIVVDEVNTKPKPMEIDAATTTAVQKRFEVKKVSRFSALAPRVVLTLCVTVERRSALGVGYAFRFAHSDRAAHSRS